jgi:hypothetical protein
LITEFDAILDKVEKRQVKAILGTHNSEQQPWNMVAEAVAKKQMSNKPYLSAMYPDMAQCKFFGLISILISQF